VVVGLEMVGLFEILL